MLIALDAMGGDHAPAEIIAGALLARAELQIDIALIGAKEVIEAELARQGETPAAFEIIHASEAIGMDEHMAPARARRGKPCRRRERSPRRRP